MSVSLQSSLHGLYVALFHAHQGAPDLFHHGRLIKMLNALVGIEKSDRKLVGITPEALLQFKRSHFKAQPGTFCLAYRDDQRAATRLLFERPAPLDVDAFLPMFTNFDKTVLALKSQQRHGALCGAHIVIDHDGNDLFRSYSLAAWKHSQKERDFLKNLYDTHAFWVDFLV